MTTVFHARPYGGLIEIQSNLRRKKLHRTNQGFKCLGESFSNRVNLRSPIQTRRKRQPQHLENELSSKTNLNESTEVTNACLTFSNQVIKDGTLKEVRVTYLKHLILAFLNVNSNRNKLT